MISVKAQIDDVLKGLNEVEKAAVPRAARSAINKSATVVRKRTQDELAKEMGLRKKSSISKLIIVRRASTQKLEAVIVTSNADKGIGMDHSKMLTFQNGTKGKRKITTVSFKGKGLEGAFRIKKVGSLTNAAFRQAPGSYKNGNRRVQRLLLYPLTQELIHAKVDQIQSDVAGKQFDVMFAKDLQDQLRKVRMA